MLKAGFGNASIFELLLLSLFACALIVPSQGFKLAAAVFLVGLPWLHIMNNYEKPGNALADIRPQQPVLLDPATQAGIVGYMREMPIRHGLTIGELARLFNGERKIGADLTVVAMTGWRREAWFDETGLAWISPSPNMRTLYAAALYPGIGAFERTNLSVGRGTDTPFEHVGAPWIDAVALAATLNARHMPGVRFYPETFTPTASTFVNQQCHGIFIVVTDRDALRPVRVGVEIASAIESLFPAKLDVDKAATLFGSAEGLAQLKAGADPATLAAAWTDVDARWRALTRPYLLY